MDSTDLWHQTLTDPPAFWTGMLVVATTLLWLFTAALWWVTYRLSKDARAASADQADKMEQSIAAAHAGVQEAIDANTIAREARADAAKFKQRELRPWLTLLVEAADGVTFGPEGCRFSISITVRNAGTTLAKGIHVYTEADNMVGASNADLTFFERALAKRSNHGDILAPNESLTQLHGLLVTSEQLMRRMDAGSEQFVMPTVGVSLTYLSIDGEAVHQTARNYMMITSEGGTARAIVHGTNLPREQIGFDTAPGKSHAT
jgi:hypothetical protein